MMDKSTVGKGESTNLIREPSMPLPGPPITSKDRIAVLERGLDPEDPLYAPRQEVNLRALIRMYEQKEITVNDDVWIIEGRRVTAKECEKPKAPCFREFGAQVLLQMASKASYGHGSHRHGHELYGRMRLLQAEGGDGTIKRISFLNDTGSDVLTLFDIDLPQLGDRSNHAGVYRMAPITNSTGGTEFLPIYRMEVQMETVQGEAWGPWFQEEAVLRTMVANQHRLSGNGIRQTFFIGTAPGSDIVAFAETKGGMSSLL